MFSLVFGRSCLFLSLVLSGLNTATASSIYVGRHEAATISEPSESVHIIPEESCEDSNKRLCHKIVKFYGEGVCTTNDRALQHTVQSICQATCGFCYQDCEDQFEDLCTDYAEQCNTDGDLGMLMKEICPKTCKSCQLRPHKENNLVVIHSQE